MPRPKKPVAIVGVHDHFGNLRVDITLGSGERRRISVEPYTQAAAVRWSQKRAVMMQQIAYGLFRWQDWFTPEQWNAGGANGPSAMTFAEVAALVLKAGKPQTIEVKRSRLKHWDALADRRMSTLLPMHIEAAAAEAKLSEMSPNTQRAVLSLLTQTLDKAEANGIISSDAMSKLKKACKELTPTRPKPVIECFTVEQMERLLNTLREHFGAWVHNYFEVMFFTGMRPCEARALLWSDVDLAAKAISIKRAKYASFDEAEPKTPKSKRTIRLNARAFAALSRQRALTQLGGGLVFKHPSTGEYIDYHVQHDGVNARWREAIEMAGVPDLRPYATRHTYATMSLMNEVKPAFLSKQLGHDSPQTTFTYYAKWIDGDDDAAEAAKLDGIGRQIRPESVPSAK